MNTIREDYRAKRLKGRIRIREIAEVLNCTKSLISNWENGRGYMCKEKVSGYFDYIDNKSNIEKEGEKI